MDDDINMIQRTHSWRNWEPAELRAIAEKGEDGKQRVREILDYIESGRFEPILSETLTFYVRLDADERKEFWRRNPDLMRWVNVYAVANHLNKATTHRPAEIPLEPDGR